MIDFDQLNDIVHQLTSDGYLPTDMSSVADTLAHSGIDITTLSDAQLEALLSSLGPLDAVEVSQLDQLVTELPQSLIRFGSEASTCGDYNLH